MDYDVDPRTGILVPHTSRRKRKYAPEILQYHHKYRRDTGEDPRHAPKRIAKMQSVIRQWGLRLDQVKIIKKYDKIWNQRRTRTPLEKYAVKLGYTNFSRHTNRTYILWIYPLSEPRK